MLDEVRPGYLRYIAVFGTVVHPCDLIHADQHGAGVIPQAVAREVINATHEIERDEKVMMGLCKSDTFFNFGTRQIDFSGILALLGVTYPAIAEVRPAGFRFSCRPATMTWTPDSRRTLMYV